jgi:hypothetical protein
MFPELGAIVKRIMPLGTINAAKELALACQPLLLAEFAFSDGAVLRCSTHALLTVGGGFQYAGHDYLPPIPSQDITALQILSEQGIALPPSVSAQLNDGTQYRWANYEQAKTCRGARLTLRFVFWNVYENGFSSDDLTPFVGIRSAASADETPLTVRAPMPRARRRREPAGFRVYWGGLFGWSAARCHLLSLGARKSMKTW